RYARRLETALAQAEQAISAELADERLSVSSDLAEGTLRFAAIASNADQAVAAATGLRAEYLNSRPANTAGDQLAPVLEALATDIAIVEADLDEINSLRSDEVANIQREALHGQVETATKDLVVIEARLLDAGLTEEQRMELEEQKSAAEATIAAVGPLLERLPASSESIADTQSRLQAMVLQRRLADLESQYVSAALQQAEGETEGLIGVPFVVEQTSEPVSPWLSVVAGLAAGAFVGAMGILASDRYSDPVRTVDDVAGLTAIRVSRRPRKLAGSVGWYQTARGNARRIDIQALRARIDRLVGRGKIVLIAGVDAPPRDVMDVAVDLASAVSATGRTVLFLDTRIGEVGPWEEAGTSLAEILKAQDASGPDRSAIKSLLWDRSHVAPNLLVVPAGSLIEDPIDALAGIAFAAVVEEARDLVDLVILATGDVTEPTSEAVAGRTRLAVLAAQKDRTRKKDLLAGAASLEHLGVSVAAVALLVGLSSGRQSRRGSQNIPQSARVAAAPWARHLGGS
ncbi:MAG TPA: hypothetical protein VJ935_09795, partial [Acidimicrobiia bacterium]|nr:hypothetical protein [Acidimicrobiia bacterium]